MREPRYSILVDIQDATERAKQGKLALYWQRTIQREYRCKKVTPAEQQAYEQLQSILSEVPQWSGEEDLRHNMENIGGRVWFCHFWIDHDSMVQLTEDRNGRFHTAYRSSWLFKSYAEESLTHITITAYYNVDDAFLQTPTAA